MFATRYFAYNGRKYRNHNQLLFGYKGTDGIKTGYTRASGFNLTASVHRGDKHLVAVVLGGKTGSQRDAAMRALLDKHFAAPPTPSRPRSSSWPLWFGIGRRGYRVPTCPKLVRARRHRRRAPGRQTRRGAQARPTAAEAELETFVTSPAKSKKPSFAIASSVPEPSTWARPTTSHKATPAIRLKPPSAACPGPPQAKRVRQAESIPAPSTSRSAPTRLKPKPRSRLGVVQSRAAELLDGHLPFTTSFTKDRCRVVSGPFRRLLQGRRAERVRRPQEDVGRLRSDARRIDRSRLIFARAGPLSPR